MDGGRPFALAFHAHPGIEVVSRDRSGLCADGTARRAPGAKQVVDRWHLLEISDKHYFPERAPRTADHSALDRYKPYLGQRWDAGCRNGLQLYRRIEGPRLHAFAGNRLTVHRRAAPKAASTGWSRHDAAAEAAGRHAPRPPGEAPGAAAARAANGCPNRLPGAPGQGRPGGRGGGHAGPGIRRHASGARVSSCTPGGYA
jgi:hypothetical protein